jgi:hypothetical protein
MHDHLRLDTLDNLLKPGEIADIDHVTGRRITDLPAVASSKHLIARSS